MARQVDCQLSQHGLLFFRAIKRTIAGFELACDHTIKQLQQQQLRFVDVDETWMVKYFKRQS